MKRLLVRMMIAATAVVAVPVLAQTQGPGERQAQARLPQGKSALWATLRTTRIGMNEAKGIFTASHPPAVKALVGKNVTLTGFLMPFDTATRGTHFLLSKYTPVCPFCPPGEPNEVVEVRTTKPVAFAQRMIQVTGTFGLQNNGDNGLFFQMTGASVQ